MTRSSIFARASAPINSSSTVTTWPICSIACLGYSSVPSDTRPSPWCPGGVNMKCMRRMEPTRKRAGAFVEQPVNTCP
eukprot:1595009-Prymnesium_polylepis.1